MGVDLSSYRLRIGLFSHMGCGKSPKSDRSKKKWFCDKPPDTCFELLCTILAAALIILLLLSAAIEPNPGPVLMCRKCEFQCKSQSVFVRHQYVHSQSRNFKFLCPYLPCPHSFKNLNSFKCHLQSAHPKKTDPKPADVQPSSTSLQCRSCSKPCLTPDALRLHLCHHLDQGQQVFCPFKSCKRYEKNKFVKSTTFRVHWSEYHKHQPIYQARRVETENSLTGVSQTVDPPNLSDSDSENDNDFNDNEEITNEQSYASKIHDFMAKFYLKLETSYHVASSTVQMISDDLVKITEMTQQSIATSLRSSLLNCGLDEDAVKNILLLMYDADIVHKIHHKGLTDEPLVSKHLRNNYFKKHYRHVPPKSIFVGRNQFGKKRYVHYVPLAQSLEAMLEDESVKKQVRQSFSRTSRQGVYSDYTDGEYFQTRFAEKYTKAIHLILFQDGLELVNPLGAARVKHKAIGVYFTLGNLSPKSRSKVHTIQLAQIFFEKDLKYFTHEKMFKDLLSDLKKLERDGIMFDGERIPVVLPFIVGDSLGSHMIGGFQESFSVQYFCRYCEIDRDTFKRSAHQLTAPFRTESSYERYAKRVKETPDMESFRGVKFSSVFNQLDSFHVCAPGLPPCLAHDFYLGVVPHDMNTFINHFVVKARWFTHEILSRRIANFKFRGNDARDRPPTLTQKKHQIKGSAVQNWNLLRFFGLIVGDLVKDTNDPVWRLYLSLKKIGELISAPVIHECQVTYLDNLIEEYLYDLARCPPLLNKVAFLCKHHYLRHYAMLILINGPLPRLWTLQFEAKHSWMRQAALTSKNFIHVTKTLAEKHQLNYAYLCTDTLFPEDIDCSSPSPLDISVFTEAQRLVIQTRIPNPHLAYQVKMVGTPPVQYRENLWIVLKHDDEGLHVGRIVTNIRDEFNAHYLLMDKFVAQLNEDFGHFEVEGRFVRFPIACMELIEGLENYYPLNHYLMNGKICISLKYSVLRQEDLV